jgi:hypothetical protein
VSIGLPFRVLRDSQAISRQSFLEFDLETMFVGEVYSDFILLCLTTNATPATQGTLRSATLCALDRCRASTFMASSCAWFAMAGCAGHQGSR